ncbi:hypothetical protein [Mycobacteroides franklinii]|uniref:Tyr recombinase domain-containing protein n=1 Tax=Mycobacteroides franklinii TaxID=948102 RepID=A0A4R8QV94_9MYCO|nr:hypothetical protein [Mycobacteroides franklinii]TDZ46356.1 hypothetical protein CCUG64054_00175 [Mycobacteroides franklinii]TDZ47865.1 hypothetical protein CCUG63697_04159 [Mycobacteroides franklinii]TDZ60074.1 hypothetical protein CCUG63696_00178 [Mycobacteroides franklinii]TDZ65473.1 hypothetical protein CCUG63695_01175 [Mycobacteroides franklinii]TDZ73642.1 hypothetical protein CCUG64056_00175 [Mycobacteroides franklinii]
MLAKTRSVFDDLVNQGIVVRNVAALVKRLPAKKAEMHTLDGDPVVTLLDATAGDPFAIAWLFAVYGLRRGEILAIDIDKDIDATTIRRRVADRRLRRQRERRNQNSDKHPHVADARGSSAASASVTRN